MNQKAGFLSFISAGVMAGVLLSAVSVFAPSSKAFGDSGSTGLQAQSTRSGSRFLESYLQFLRVLQERQGGGDIFNGLGFYASLEVSKRVVNLTPYRVLPGESPRWPQTLILDDFQNGFRVTRKWKYDFAAGPGHIFEDLPALFGGPFSALMPAIGQSATATQTFERAEEIPKGSFKIKIPHAAGDTASWRNGDRISFEASGGVLFGVGANFIPLVGIEGRFLAKGVWAVDVEKFGEQSVYMKITKRKVTSFTQVASAIGTMVSRKDFGQIDSFFSFAFDLSDPAAARAYEHAMAGDLEVAGALADAGSDSVKRLLVGDSLTYGNSTKFTLGISLLLNLSWERDKEKATLHSHVLDSGTKRTQRYAIYQTQFQRGGLLLVGARNGTSFLARHSTDETADGAAVNNYSGELQWSFEREKTKKKHLVKALTAVTRKLGLEKELELRIPEMPMGYLSATLKVAIPQKATDALIESASGPDENAQLRLRAEALIDRYFENGTDPAGICFALKDSSYNDGPVDGAGSGFDGARETLEECKTRYQGETLGAISKMMAALREMKSTRTTDPGKFVSVYAKFGKWLTRNRFAFHAVLDQIQEIPAGAVFMIEGQRVSRFVRQIR